MEPRKVSKQKPRAPEVPKKEPGTRLRVVKLEERIAPKLAVNHSETVVREPAQDQAEGLAIPQGARPVPRRQARGADRPQAGDEPQRDAGPATAGAKPKAAEPRKTKGRLRIVKLEERIAPKIATNHNETVVRDRSDAR